jgi:hypothetical protein
MNTEITTPRTDEQHKQFPMGGFTLDFASQLERELAEAQNMINLLRESHDVVTKQFQKVDTELAEMRKQRNKWAYECGENMKLLKETIATATRAIEQRDTLAEALEMITTHTIADGQCENGYSAAYVAKKALAAVKGEKP